MKRTQNIFELEGNYLNGHGTNCAGKASVTGQIGEKHIANNGCEYTIVEANNCSNVLVEFEDGMRVRTSSSAVRESCIAHPTLKAHGFGTFAGFTTALAFKEDGKVYYKSWCQYCDCRHIFTPSEMLQHEKDAHSIEAEARIKDLQNSQA